MQQVAIINEPSAIERRNKVLLNCEKAGVKQARVIYGFTPKDMPDFKPDFWFNQPEQKAIAYSHLNAIKGTTDSWWILEDDVVFCKNFISQFDEFLQKVPSDWDCLYLGFTPIDPHSVFEIHNGYAELMSDCMGAWAYSIRGNARMEYANLLTKMSADTALEQLQRKYRFYSAYPFIATVQDGYSYNSRMPMKWPSIQNNFIDNKPTENEF